MFGLILPVLDLSLLPFWRGGPARSPSCGPAAGRAACSARVLVIFFNRSGVTQHGESRYRAPKSTYCCSIFSYDPLRHAEWHFVCFEVMAAANRKFFNFEYSLYAISPGRTVE